MTSPDRHEVRAGWSVPRPEIVPGPTPWPAALALGVAFIGWGLITSPIILGLGLLVAAVSLGGWIGDIRHES